MSEYYKSISAHPRKFHTILKTFSFPFNHILIICCIIGTRYLKVGQVPDDKMKTDVKMFMFSAICLFQMFRESLS